MTDVPVKDDGMFKTAVVAGSKGELEISLRSDGNAIKFNDSRTGNTRLDVWQDRITFHNFREEGANYEVYDARVATAMKDVIKKAFDDNLLTDDEQRQIEALKNMLIGDIKDKKLDDVGGFVSAAKGFVPSKKTR